MRLLIVAIMLLSGCAQMHNRRSASKYAPKNELTRPRTVSYSNEGAGFVVAARREASYKQMYRDCGGEYEIVGEGPRSDGGVAIPMGGTSIYQSTESWFITYKCSPSVSAVPEAAPKDDI